MEDRCEHGNLKFWRCAECLALENEQLVTTIAALEAENAGLKVEARKTSDDRLIAYRNLLADYVVRKREMEESARLAREAIDDDDFAPQFDQKNHMTGPALRGVFERILDCAARASGEGGEA